MFKTIIQWHRNLVQPRSHQPEIARKEHIFYILLIGSLYLAGVAALLVSGSFIRHYLARESFHGAPPGLIIIVVLSLVSLYQISRQKRPQLAAHIYLITLWIITAYTSLRWGALLYQAVLMYSLIIVFTGILISTKIAFITTLVTSITITLLTYLQAENIIYHDNLWRQTPPHLGNAITISFTLSVIALFSWLSNREISRALTKAQYSKLELKKERDSLEAKVKKRTQQLKQSQLEKMIGWQRFVDMGKIASGLFHDMRNYLTSVTLDIELDENQRALRTMQQMKAFMQSTQKQLADENQTEWFSPTTEIKELLVLLKHPARKYQVQFVLGHLSSQRLYGPVSIFHQIIINLLSNAIDAYDGITPTPHQTNQIKISFTHHRHSSTLVIKDFGCGISSRQQAQIFKPFMTTKTKTDNFGLGLFLTRSALEQHFSGKISLTSKLKLGSTFTLTFPHLPQPHN